MDEVNSENYWDNRFQENWDEREGNKQSEFFMNLALNMLPGWFKKVLKDGDKSVLDWGCAEGDGTHILARTFPESTFEGIDFAKTAIETANKIYKRNNLKFRAVDLLTQKSSKTYDIVFSSNVLEHFHDTWKVFEKISSYANHFMVIMVPFNEDPNNLVSEHFHSFNSRQFNLHDAEWDIVHFTVKRTEIYWIGQQAVIIFAKKGLAGELNLNFETANLTADRLIETEDRNKELNELNISLEKIIKEQTQQIIEYELQIEAQQKHLISGNGINISGGNGRDSFLTNEKATRITGNISRKLYKKAKKIKDYKVLHEYITLLRSSGYFDENYYLTNNPDIKNHPIDPVEHYLRYGYKEGRQPSLLFDQEFYLAKYPDIQNEGIIPLVHFLLYGKQEGRKPRLDYQIDLKDKRIGIAFQLDAFDKGGLEEVVLMLASNESIKRDYRVYIFVKGESGYLADVAKQRDITVISLENNTDLLSYLIKELQIKITNLHYSLFGINQYKHHGVKLIYTVHNNYVWLDDDTAILRLKEYRKIDRFIAVSDQVAQYFSNRFHIPPNLIHTVTNGVEVQDVRNFSPVDRTKYNLNINDFVFINVASFSPYKFHADLVAAFGRIVQKHPTAKLIMVGNVIDENYFKTIIQLVAKYKIQNNVQIIDYIPKDQLLGLLKLSDCFVLPSLTEGFSIAMIEAMYSQLPMILSDVGGARHAIHENDTGIVVKNAYGNPVDLTSQMITDKFTDDSNLNNLDELFGAMDDMITDAPAWKKKAKKGKEKVLAKFLSTNVADGYIREFQNILVDGNKDLLDEFREIIKNTERAFFAPYPTRERVTEGWMSRINAVDKLIGNTGKLYVNVLQNNSAPKLDQHDNNGWELTIGKESHLYSYMLDEVFQKIQVAYVHTLHLAEFALPWLNTKKVIVDFHGITPEEEVMLGRPHLKEKYEIIEQEVISKAKACVMVTKSMLDHYNKKYPNLKPKKTIILPIVEDISIAKKKSFAPTNGKKHKIVYSGGTQTWQNIDSMLRLAIDSKEFANFIFLSHDWETIKQQGEKIGAPANTKYEFCEKSKLFKKYQEFDFGLVLRDDTPVNRVACPTKLYEYMACGVIPIVRTEQLGDFKELGYQFITEENFRANKFPGYNKLSDMLNQNYGAIDKLIALFSDGNNKLLKLIKG